MKDIKIFLKNKKIKDEKKARERYHKFSGEGKEKRHQFYVRRNYLYIDEINI